MLRISEVAYKLGVERSTVMYWIKTGKVTAVKDSMGKWCLTTEEFNRFKKAYIKVYNKQK